MSPDLVNEFRLIPAIDLLGGRVVRLFKGDYARSTVYGDDPTEPVREFLAAGADLIHLVDLDAARQGDRSVNREAIAAILRAVREAQERGQAPAGARVEIGGGIRTLSAIEAYRALGVDRCILGTVAVRDPELVSRAIERHGAKHVIVGVDALDGVVRVSGWEESSGLRVTDFVADLERRGVAEIIFTDIARDGAMSGPPVAALRDLLAQTRLRVIASGGVSALEDLRALLELREPRLVGAISGRAIYEKKLDVREAVELCRAFS